MAPVKVARWYRVEGLRIVQIDSSEWDGPTGRRVTRMTLVDALEAGVELASCVAELTALVTSGERGSGRPSRR